MKKKTCHSVKRFLCQGWIKMLILKGNSPHYPAGVIETCSTIYMAIRVWKGSLWQIPFPEDAALDKHSYIGQSLFTKVLTQLLFSCFCRGINVFLLRILVQGTQRNTKATPVRRRKTLSNEYQQKLTRLTKDWTNTRSCFRNSSFL